MNHYLEKRSLSMVVFWTGMVFWAFCCIDCGTDGVFAGNDMMKKQILKPDEIKVGEFVHCIQISERKMKTSGDQFKNIITIYGLVVKIRLPDIYINVAGVFASNLRRENAGWVQDYSIVKRPPYTIGNTYAFRFKHDVIDTVVSTGLNQMYFEYP